MLAHDKHANKHAGTPDGIFSSLSNLLKGVAKLRKGSLMGGRNTRGIHTGALTALYKAPEARLICFVIGISGESRCEDGKVKMAFFLY